MQTIEIWIVVFERKGNAFKTVQQLFKIVSFFCFKKSKLFQNINPISKFTFKTVLTFLHAVSELTISKIVSNK